jgi:hypothetical protein
MHDLGCVHAGGTRASTAGGMRDAAGNPIPTDPPRALAPIELARIARISPELARSLEAGTCPSCETNRTGVMHADACRMPRPPVEVRVVGSNTRQPWDPRPSRRAA